MLMLINLSRNHPRLAYVPLLTYLLYAYTPVMADFFFVEERPPWSACCSGCHQARGPRWSSRCRCSPWRWSPYHQGSPQKGQPHYSCKKYVNVHSILLILLSILILFYLLEEQFEAIKKIVAVENKRITPSEVQRIKDNVDCVEGPRMLPKGVSTLSPPSIFPPLAYWLSSLFYRVTR